MAQSNQTAPMGVPYPDRHLRRMASAPVRRVTAHSSSKGYPPDGLIWQPNYVTLANDNSKPGRASGLRVDTTVPSVPAPPTAPPPAPIRPHPVERPTQSLFYEKFGHGGRSGSSLPKENPPAKVVANATGRVAREYDSDIECESRRHRMRPQMSAANPWQGPNPPYVPADPFYGVASSQGVGQPEPRRVAALVEKPLVLQEADGSEQPRLRRMGSLRETRPGTPYYPDARPSHLAINTVVSPVKYDDAYTSINFGSRPR